MPARRKKRTSLGERIKELMDSRGWDQLGLASASDLPRSTVSRTITGSTSPDLETIYALAAALDVPFEELIGRALYDLTQKEVKFSDAAPSAEELAAVVRAFPWLTAVVKEMAALSPTEQRGILAYLEAQKSLRQTN